MTDTSPQWQNRIVRYGEMPAHQFLANPQNPRRHPSGQRDALRGSFDALGIIAPILVNARTQYMIDGHARVEECLSRDENMLIPFIEVDLSEEEEALALASFDWITQMATYDKETLDDLLQGIDTDNAALQALLDDLATQNGIDLLEDEPLEDAGAEIDKGDALAQRYGTELGQIWQLGRHRLAIGDSTDRGVVEALMEGKKADCVIADAPYGMKLNTHYKRDDDRLYNGAGDANRKNYNPVIGDHEDFDPRPIMELIDAEEQFWFGADYYAERIPNKNDGSWLVWDKRFGIEDIKFSLSEFELIWSKKSHLRSILRVKWFGIQGMEKQDTKERVHPTQKPLELIMMMIEQYTKPNALIVDPFLGSGTTMAAAQMSSRICYGCEIDPVYGAVILERMSRMGLAPLLVKEPSGKHIHSDMTGATQRDEIA